MQFGQDKPWRRITNRTPIPDPVTAALLAQMPDQHFYELIRDNRQPSGSNNDHWRRMWRLLARDEDLTTRAYDALEKMLDTAEADSEIETLPDADLKRIRKFINSCQECWKKLDDGSAHPLTGLGRGETERALRILVMAVERHRSGVLAAGTPTRLDRELWSQLRRVGLDSTRPE